MNSARWRVSNDLNPRKLSDGRTLAHNALHWLARLAHSYRAPEPDQRHVMLAFDGGRHAFITQPFANDLTVELRLPTLHMQFRESGQLVPHTLDFEGHSSAQIEAWALVELLHRAVDRDKFSKQLPYDVHKLMSGDSVEYSPEAFGPQLEAISDWFGNADLVLKKIASKHANQGTPQPLVCWPETFELGLVIGPEPAGGAGERAVRVAFSPGCERHPEPYFFVAEQTRGVAVQPNQGVVLTASAIVADKLSADQVSAQLEAMIATARLRKAG